MLLSKRRTRSVIAVLLIAGVSLLRFPATAQQAGPSSKATVSDSDFVRLQQQIKQLKNATFRAFLRVQLLSWDSPEPGPTRHQAAMEVAAQAVTDLCDHQDEVWWPTASWLHGRLVEQIKSLRSAEETAPEICVLKSDAKSNSAGKDLSSGIKMLSNPETSADGLNLARSAILTGEVPAGAMLGQLLTLNAKQSPHLLELLGALLDLEEKQPGTLPLSMLPFFTSLFRTKTVPPEMLTRYIAVAVRASRLSSTELADRVVSGSVYELLNGIIGPAKELTPALYPEIAGRLSSISRTGLTPIETRLAAEERIEKADDRLEQLISEANSASDKQRKKHFFFLAARVAKERGQLNKAVDLIIKATYDDEQNKGERKVTFLDDFLSEIVLLALKKKSPQNATYAIPNMTQPLTKARAFRLLGEYYGANQDNARSNEAFTQAVKELKSIDNSNEKVRSTLILAEGVLKYQPDNAYEVFRDAVKAINNLPPPEKDKEMMYYVQLLPVAEDLIRSFRSLATRENQTATNLGAEIKLSELRVSALSGAYSR